MPLHDPSHTLYSPSDLTQFLQSPFAAWMERLAKLYPERVPPRDQDDSMAQLLQEKGADHEAALLSQWAQAGFRVTDLSSVQDKLQATSAAMKRGEEVIYQGALQAIPWYGIADFLVKVNGASDLGDYHYEVWDSKLSNVVKPQFTMQLCCYQDMLKAIQGRFAEYFVIVLGDGQPVRLRTEDYVYYYQSLKRAFLRANDEFDPEQQPDPADSTEWGDWQSYAHQLLLDSDHLSQVATVTRSQIKKFNDAGIFTMAGLAETANERISGISSAVFQRLKSQAAIQKASADLASPRYQVLIPKAGQPQGLSLLPPHSDYDVFFDIEGYPLVDGGLEYLWGSVYFDEHGKRQFKDFWAHDKTQEKEIFQEFIAWVYQRWQRDPNMHVYHYAHYEIAACRKLMSRYGVCEFEVDELLRNEVFVDLYKIVKSGLLIGQPNYSIKNVEHLYRSKRQTEVGTGGDSVVVYERWRDQPDGDSWQTSKTLKSIRDYNIDDCHSTQELVGWLRERQCEFDIQYAGRTEPKQVELTEQINQRTELRDRLIEQAQNDDGVALIAEMLAWSLEFHRREAKPVFWKLFDRLGLTHIELMDDLDCLANCQRTERPEFKPTERARNFAYEYQFNPDQEFKFNGALKSFYVLGQTGTKGEHLKVTLLPGHTDLGVGRIVVQCKEEPPQTITLIPDDYINPDPMPGALDRLALAYEKQELGQCAILDFLHRDYPRIRGLPRGENITRSHQPDQRLQEIINAVCQLDHSYLVIQGPPGAGKTYTGKHVIAELLRGGKKVGISSNSHKAINNLLFGCARYCQQENIPAFFCCAKHTDPDMESLGVELVKNNEIIQRINGPCVVGTTAWGFAREELVNLFDYLFIDEAGQVSVVNLMAMSQAAVNIVLMGDQMQLAQPAQGTHPGDSGLSCLDYLLGHHPTIDENRGVFLETTYRMHSSVNRFISAGIYQGKLRADPDNDRQTVAVPPGYCGPLDKQAGIVFIPVEHRGNTQASDEEVAAIAAAATELLGRCFTDKQGQQRALGWSDMLFVAPYNFQVNKLKAALPEQAQVGTVDKFQGQEAPVVFFSLCASDAQDSPRGMDFLFEPNRINVAISRAQSLAVIVANPALTQTRASNVAQQTKINLFCHLVHCSAQ